MFSKSSVLSILPLPLFLSIYFHDAQCVPVNHILKLVCRRKPTLSYCDTIGISSTGNPQQHQQLQTTSTSTNTSERIKKATEHGLEMHEEDRKNSMNDTKKMEGEAKPADADREEKSCIALKPEYDELCSKRPHPKIASETVAFCSTYQKNCRRLLQIEAEKAYSATGEIKSNTTEDDAACYSLKPEFEKICFVQPPAATARETNAFCHAYITKCRSLIKIEIQSETNYTIYCKKHLERFRYVCPDPLRFRKYAADALSFCERYSTRCPHEQVPKKPVLFHQKKEYYMRELEYLCNGQRHFAETYCSNSVALKLPKYLLPCLNYKFTCVDVLTRVIYTG